MEYSAHFFANLTKIYKNMDTSYSDMTLHCLEDGSKLKCHRVILSACSDYFKNVFGWSKTDVLDVHNGITGHTMEIVLQYIYSGKISLTLENVNEVLIAANFFSVLHIVDVCVQFILDHLQIDNFMEVLVFSWQFNLSELTTKIVYYVARNFSSILQDVEKLTSIPVELMALILKSNDLLIRNKDTDLPTRPAEREKRILDFILSYTTNLNEYSNEDITLLLSCVKWQFLDIFNEKGYVLDEFASLLDNGQREEEVKRYLCTEHTDWFLQGHPTSNASAQDKEMYGTRAFSCSELIWTDAMATGYRHETITRDATPFMIVAKDYEHISRIDLISYDLNGHVVIIGGLKIHITSPGNDTVCHHFGLSEDDGIRVDTVELADKEHIISVKGKSYTLVDELEFETSTSRSLGPYGGGGPEEGHPRRSLVRIDDKLMESVRKFREEGRVYDQCLFLTSFAPAPHARIPLDAILVGLSGTRVIINNSYAITNLRFCFRMMTPGSTFLITNEKKCEIDLLIE